MPSYLRAGPQNSYQTPRHMDVIAGWEVAEVGNQLPDEGSDADFCEGSAVESIGGGREKDLMG